MLDKTKKSIHQVHGNVPRAQGMCVFCSKGGTPHVEAGTSATAVGGWEEHPCGQSCPQSSVRVASSLPGGKKGGLMNRILGPCVSWRVRLMTSLVSTKSDFVSSY